VNYLGNPDNGVILASYIGSYLMAGAYLAIGSLISAMTKNQVIAFVVAAAVCFLFTVAGSPILLNYFENWAPGGLVEAIANFGFLTHFDAIQRGVIDLRDVIFFGSAIVIALIANAFVIDWKKAE
jgi:ABC-2 type transport system permease protein